MSAWRYPAPVDDGEARHLVPGTVVADVALPATTGENVQLAAVPGLCVVFVYPWTGRPGLANPPDWDSIPGAHGSTPEAEGFRDLHSEFAAEGAEVFGLSTQECAYQQELAQRLVLPFRLLSDAALAFADAVSLPRFSTGGVTYLKRLTLVIQDGRLAHVFYPVHPPDTHAATVLDWLWKAPRPRSRP